MHKLDYKYYFLFLLTITFLHFCGCDSCEQVNCLNGGICNDGLCECLEEYKGQYCDVHKKPISVSFLEVEVFNIPLLKPSGDTWDEDGSAADIVVVMTFKNNGEDYKGHVSRTEDNVIVDKVSLDIPGTYGLRIEDYERTIGVYDKEYGVGALELICLYEWDLYELAEATEYSTSLLFHEPGCPGIRLEIVYNYAM